MSSLAVRLDAGLRIVSSPDAPAGRFAFPTDSIETVWFWTPALGPTAVLMLMAFDDLVARGVHEVSWPDLSLSLGLGPLPVGAGRPGVNHPMMRSLKRMLDLGAPPGLELIGDVLFVPSVLEFPREGLRRRWSALTEARAALFRLRAEEST